MSIILYTIYDNSNPKTEKLITENVIGMERLKKIFQI